MLRAIPIVILSASIESPCGLDTFKEFGAVLFVTRPIEPERLIRLIEPYLPAPPEK
jgi:CheY-like chemotaxis protein